MSVLDYSRWDKLDLSSDSDSDEALPLPPVASATVKGTATSAPAGGGGQASRPGGARTQDYERLMGEYAYVNAYFPEAVAALAKGLPFQREHRWEGGGSGGAWLIKTRRGPILNNSVLNSSDNSHIGWRRELNLTLFAGQHLPEAMYGANSLEVYHERSGVRISFCALDALRSWTLLDHPAVPHLRPNAPLHEWDYSFTTDYSGSTAVAPPGTGVSHLSPRHLASPRHLVTCHPSIPPPVVQLYTRAHSLSALRPSAFDRPLVLLPWDLALASLVLWFRSHRCQPIPTRPPSTLDPPSTSTPATARFYENRSATASTGERHWCPPAPLHIKPQEPLAAPELVPAPTPTTPRLLPGHHRLHQPGK